MGRPARQLATRLRPQTLELEGVGPLGGDLQHVAGGPGHDHVPWHTRIAQTLAQPRDGRAQRDLAPLTVVLAPHRVHEPIDRDDDVAVDEKARHSARAFMPPISTVRPPQATPTGPSTRISSRGQRLGREGPHAVTRRIALRHAGPLPIAPVAVDARHSLQLSLGERPTGCFRVVASRLRRHLLDEVVGMLLAEAPDRVADHERVAYGAYEALRGMLRIGPSSPT